MIMCEWEKDEVPGRKMKSLGYVSCTEFAEVSSTALTTTLYKKILVSSPLSLAHWYFATQMLTFNKKAQHASTQQ